MATLDPAPYPECVRLLAPCLQLVAPVGMTTDDQDSWFDAAFMALGHLPADMLAEGARKAMRLADHPSKIVPTIIRETAGWLATRRAAATRAVDALPAPSKDNRPADERRNVQIKMGQLLKDMIARNGRPEGSAVANEEVAGQ